MLLPSSHAVWQPDSESQRCSVCLRKYSLFNRRHHCRKCGRVVCGKCSQNEITYLPHTGVVSRPNSEESFDDTIEPPRKAQPGHTYKTCDPCCLEINMLKAALGLDPEEPLEHTESTESEASSTDRSPSITPSKDDPQTVAVPVGLATETFAECPICQTSMGQFLTDAAREAHIDACLTTMALSPDTRRDVKRNHLLVYDIPIIQSGPHTPHRGSVSDGPETQGEQHLKDDPAGESSIVAVTTEPEAVEYEECIICLEEMTPGAKVGRLEFCLCVFHYGCIKDWFNKKKWGECPVHHTYNYE